MTWNIITKHLKSLKYYCYFIYFRASEVSKGCGCLNRTTTQVSQTRRWVSPVDYTDGDSTAPKLDTCCHPYRLCHGSWLIPCQPCFLWSVRNTQSERYLGTGVLSQSQLRMLDHRSVVTHPHRWHTTITVWFSAILAMSLVVIFLVRLDQLDGSPLEFRNCLTVDALMPKFTSSGREPIAFATFSLLSWETTTPIILPFSSYIGPPLLPFWTAASIG